MKKTIQWLLILAMLFMILDQEFNPHPIIVISKDMPHIEPAETRHWGTPAKFAAIPEQAPSKVLVASTQEERGNESQINTSTVEKNGNQDSSINPLDVLRIEYIKIDTSTIATTKNGRLSMNLFGEPYVTDVVRLQDGETGIPSTTTAWVGTFGKNHTGHMTMVLKEDCVSATLNLMDNDRIITIQPVGDGLHMITERDARLLPVLGCLNIGESDHDIPTAPSPASPSTETMTEMPLAGNATMSDPLIVDVFIFYTTQARIAAGGEVQIKSQIEEAVVGSNYGLRNSLIPMKYRLVGQGEQPDWTESGGFLHASFTSQYAINKREELGADLVMLITSTVQSGYAGQAYIYSPWINYDYSAYAYGWTTLGYISIALAHEFGHMLGSHHDHANGGAAAYPYSYGYNVNGWGTIMAYPGTRIPHFSNPKVTYQGTPTGVEDWADNARSITNTMGVIANYRATKVPLNKYPVAMAGSDIEAHDEANLGYALVNLDGSNSYDPDGTIQTYEWSLNQTLFSTAKNPAIYLSVGKSTLTLRVTDNGSPSLSAEDEITITVWANNKPPVADAGPDMFVFDDDFDGEASIQLTGSLSKDVDGQIVQYEWHLDASLVGNTVHCGLVKPCGVYEFTLKVADNGHPQKSSMDKVLVTIKPGNRAPVAMAGADQTLIDDDQNGMESVALDGSGSSDPDGTLVSYEWTSGGGVLSTAAKPTLTLPVGTHTLVLTVKDKGTPQKTATDEVIVVVLKKNQPPMAYAGQDQAARDDDLDGLHSVALDGSGSSDPDGSIVLHEWKAGGVVLATGAKPILTLPVGTHNLVLTVKDNGNPQKSASDEVLVTIVKGNQPPLAVAGVDQTLRDDELDGLQAVQLNGSGSSDPDGSLVVYEWRSGDTVVATGVKPIVTLPVGTHTLVLSVQDNGSPQKMASDVLIVTILKGNLPPLAAAGADQTLRDDDLDGVQTVLLDGSGSSDPDGALAFYEWACNGVVLATGAKPTLSLPVGTHTLVLTVKDNGNPQKSASDEVLVTIVKGNQPPLAAAGADQTLRDDDLDGMQTVFLDGSGSSDPDGTLVLYEWTSDGVVLATVATPTLALPVGPHTLVMTVKDNGTPQKSASDEITVTILKGNQHPLASAGEDQTLRDNDLNGMEHVVLNGGASHDPDGNLTTTQWKLDGAIIANELVTTVQLPLGKHVLTLEVVDDGMPVKKHQDDVVVDIEKGNAAPKVEVFASQMLGRPPLPVTFKARASDEEPGSVVLYQWDFDGDGLLDREAASGEDMTHVFEYPGNYRPTLTVFDNEGSSTTTFIHVTVLQKVTSDLVADFLGDPMTGQAPLEVNFKDYSAGPTSPLRAWLWDFNSDGMLDASSPITGDKTHVYRYPGTYECALTVIDENNRRNTLRKTVVVTPAQDAPRINSISYELVVENGNALETGYRARFTLDTYAASPVEFVQIDMDNDGKWDRKIALASLKDGIVFLKPGSHTARFQVEDSRGAASDISSHQFEITAQSRIWISEPVSGSAISGNRLRIMSQVWMQGSSTFQIKYRLRGSTTFSDVPTETHSDNTALGQLDIGSFKDNDVIELQAFSSHTDESGQALRSSIITVTKSEGAPGSVYDMANAYNDTYFSATTPTHSGITLNTSQRSSLSIPLGAVTLESVKVEIARIPTLDNPETGSATNFQTNAANIWYRVHVGMANTHISVPEKPLLLTLPYEDKNQDGLVDGTSIREETLSLHWFDVEERKWKQVLSCDIDGELNLLHAKIIHLTDFGLFGGASLNPTVPILTGVSGAVDLQPLGRTAAQLLKGGNQQCLISSSVGGHGQPILILALSCTLIVGSLIAKKPRVGFSKQPVHAPNSSK